MRKIKLLSTIALSAMLSVAPAYAEVDFNDVPEEEVASAIANVLKKNPKIVYDSLEQFYKDRDAKTAEYKEDGFSPLEQKIAAVLKENPLLLVGALQVYDQEQQQKELMKTANNYKEHLAEINEADIFVGPENAKYTMVEFFDFSCGYCKKMAPKLKNIIEKNPDVKFIFKPVTFLAPISETAAKAAIAAHKQGKYLDMYTRLMAEVRVNEPGIDKIAQEIGLDMEKYKQDMNAPETSAILEKVRGTADKIQMKSVPTLILNGMPLYAVEEVQIQHAIDVLRNTF